MLIPDFLKEIELVVIIFYINILLNYCTKINSKSTSPEVKKNSIIILNSLICYPRQFDNLDFPIMVSNIHF